MCGITGYFSLNNAFSETELHDMTEAIAHRGPDAYGYFLDNFVGLGHRRLSILDLSDNANLPMHSFDNRYVIVYNGEVYNYREIAVELKQKCDINFRTSSDTEVILEAYAYYGSDIVQKLNGMFAFAIYDKFKNELFLCRDRIGIKPFFYFWDGKSFAFASELKSLLQIKFIKNYLKIDSLAINEYLHLGYIPEPHSIYKNIYKFPSGCYCFFSGKELNITRYWNINEKISANTIIQEQEAKKIIKEKLISAVKSNMICDVPFGTFLSGGIDSSLVTAIAQSQSLRKIKTFSIGFKDTSYDESSYARAVSKHLGTEHFEYFVTEKDAQNLIPELTDIYDEPFADSSAIPTLLVSKMAHNEVKMVLSGDGGDELFLGYGAYRWAERLNNPFIKIIKKPTSLILKQLTNKYKRASYLFDYTDSINLKSHIFSQEQYLFSRIEIKKILNPDFQQNFYLEEYNNSFQRHISPAEEQALFDINYYLKDDLLVKVDRVSMRNSLEVRVPLLDFSVIETVLNIDKKLKYKHNISKYILKQILYDYIPSSYFNRQKQGFAIPLQKWLKKDLKYLSDEYLSDVIIKRFNLFDLSQVQKLKNDFYNKNLDYLYNRLWLIICLNKFLIQKG